MSNETETLAMNIARVLITKHEGKVERIYADTEGIPTGGIGHAFLIGSWLPMYIWELIFEEDFARARIAAEELMSEYEIPNPGLGRKVVLIDMSFNLGKVRLRNFKKMWAALKVMNYDAAATEMLDSKWATQVGKRARDLAFYMRTGRLPNVKET